MFELLDAKGLGCGVPVVLAKKALEVHKKIIVLVDDLVNVENLKILGSYLGCNVDISKGHNDCFMVYMMRLDD